MTTSRISLCTTLALAILLQAALGLAGSPAAAEDGVSFAPQVEIKGDRVTLLDLVEPGQELGQALAEQLGRYTVAVAPALGRTTVVLGSKVRALLKQASLGEGVTVLIPEQVVVTRACQRLSAQDLARIYTEAVTERLGPQAGQAEISRVEAGHDLVLPVGKLDISLRFLSGGVLGRVPAVLDILVDGKREATGRVVGTIDIYVDMVVASRPLMPRHIIAAEDVTIQRASLNEAGPGAAMDTQAVLGMRTRSAVPMGAPLDLTRLEKAPLVRLGEVVLMVYDGGGMRITAKGRAEQTGYMGSRIRLTNLASKREVYGKVVDSGSVTVE
jgi:flagella basal body P-ring formation protein FlgA